jgi:AcrR family transcriptional regulator
VWAQLSTAPNRLRILDAAHEVFGERGLHATLDEVAARAGVGVGTVYRRFADREALVNALFESRVEELVEIAERAERKPDPWDGLVYYLREGSEFFGRNKALEELLFSASGGHDSVDHHGRPGPLSSVDAPPSLSGLATSAALESSVWRLANVASS